MKLWTIGRHRRTPEAWTSMALALEQALAEADRWQQIAEQRGHALDGANRLMGSVCAAKTTAETELETLKTGHGLLLDAYDELAARYREQAAELANRTAISVPAPADNKPAITRIPWNPDDTVWDGHTTIRVPGTRSIRVPATAAA